MSKSASVVRDVTDSEACSYRDSPFSPSKHFPWQPAMVSALSSTVGDGMIGQRPNKMLLSPSEDEVNLCYACQYVCSCGSIECGKFVCLCGTWNIQTILNIFLKDWMLCHILFYFTFSSSWQMSFVRLNFTSISREHICADSEIFSYTLLDRKTN